MLADIVLEHRLPIPGLKTGTKLARSVLYNRT